MPDITLEQQFQKFLDAGATPDEVAKQFLENYGISHRDIAPDTPMSKLDAVVKKRVTEVFPSMTELGRKAESAVVGSVMKAGEKGADVVSKAAGLASKYIPAGAPRTLSEKAALDEKLAADRKKSAGVLPANTPAPSVDLPDAALETTARGVDITEADLTQPVAVTKRLVGAATGVGKAVAGGEIVDKPASVPTDEPWYRPALMGKKLPSTEDLYGAPTAESILHPERAARAGYAEAGQTAQKKLDSEHWLTRTLKDTGDIVMGIPKLAGTLVEPLPKGTDEEKYGEQLGKAITEGAIGGTAYALDPRNYPEALEAAPLSTAAQLIPVAGGAVKMLKASGVGAKLAETSAATKLAKVVAPVVEKVAEKTTGLRQALSDTRAQASPYASGVAEELSTAGKTELASQIARGIEEVSPPPTPKGSGAHFDVSHPAEGGGLLTPGKAGEVVSRQLASAEDDLRQYNLLADATEARASANAARRDVYAARKELRASQPVQESAQAETPTSQVSDKVQQLQQRASELRREAKDLEARAAEEVSADIRRDYEALTPEQAAAFIASEEEVLKRMTRAPEPTRPAMVVSPERATALAQDLVRQAGAAPESVPIVRDRILRYYEEHPQGPEPTATTFGTFEDGKFVPAHEVRASVPPTPAEEAAYRPIQLEARQTEKMGQVAQELAGPQTTARQVYQASLKGGMPPVLPLTKEARKFFVDRLAGLHAFAKVDAEQVARLIQHIDAMEEVGGVLVNPAIKHVLMPNGASAHPLLNAFTQWAKQSLTSQNPASAINNFTANFALQTARVGDPITVGTRLARTVKDLNDWKAGKLDKNMSSALSFWEHSGLLDTTALGTDVAAVTGTTPLRFLRSKTLDWIYQAGDNIFKADEALSSLSKYERYAEQLRPGKTLDLEISPNVIARFTGGSDTVELMAGGKTLRTIPKQEALWRASARQAQNLFMDYSEVPGVAKWLREANALSVISPFSTYFLKAIDIPGLKKGLGYRMLETPRGIVGTTDMALAGEEAARSLVTAAQRAAFINGMRNTLKDESNYDLRQAISFAPTQAKLALVRQLGDTGYVGVEKMGNWNFVGPTELLFRVGVQGAGEVNQWLQGLLAGTPELRKNAALMTLRELQAIDNIQEFTKELHQSERAVAAAKMRVEKGIEGAKEEYASAVEDYGVTKEVYSRLRGMSKEQLSELKRAAEFSRRLNTTGFASTDDALNLFQLAGTPVTQALDEVRKAADMGETVKVSKLLSGTFMPVLLGGFGKNVVNTVATYLFNDGADAAKILSDYKLNDDVELNEEDFARYVIRKFTGVGWQKLPLEKMTSKQIRDFPGKARAEWLSSLGVDASAIKELERLRLFREQRGQDTSAIDAEIARKQNLAAAVDDEMGKFREQVEAALSTTTVGKLPAKSAVP